MKKGEKIIDFHIRFKEALKFRNLTQSKFAEISGINNSTISEYASGKYDPSRSRILEFAEILNVNEVWLLGFDVPIERKNTEKSPASQTLTVIELADIPMYGKASAGNGYLNLSDEIGHYSIPKELFKSSLFAVHVSGDSMTGSGKSIPDGSIAVADPELCSSDPHSLNGKVCVFEYNNEIFIKQLVVDSQNIIHLRSFNPSYEDIIVLNPRSLACKGRVIRTFIEDKW